MPTYEPTTLTYSPNVKGWPSFYSYLADYMVGMNGFFYTWSGGNLYRHNTNELRNNYYGVQYNSTITSVFNEAPMTIKLFKTMSYESDDQWECTSLVTDLSTGSMPGTPGSPLQTWFVQKEGEWFTFLRENEGSVNFRARSSAGIGTILTATGPIGATIVTFQLDNLGSILSVGDMAYQVIPSVPPAVSGTPTLIGPITNIVRQSTKNIATGVITLPSITINSAGVIPLIGNFALGLKDAVAESHGARGYYLHFTLENTNVNAVELFSVGSSIMKSFP
tara:strand:+ start:12169 stop:13002 length:834 start_codon:yes stop_codon:yes gene_type:complete